MSYIAIETAEDRSTVKRLLELADTITVDWMNETAAKSKLKADNTVAVKGTKLTITELEEGEGEGLLILLEVSIQDKDNIDDAHAYVYVGIDDEIYLDYPY